MSVRKTVPVDGDRQHPSGIGPLIGAFFTSVSGLMFHVTMMLGYSAAKSQTCTLRTTPLHFGCITYAPGNCSTTSR